MKLHNKTTPNKTLGRGSNTCRPLYLCNQTECSKRHRLDMKKSLRHAYGENPELSQLPKISDAIVRERSHKKNKITQ